MGLDRAARSPAAAALLDRASAAAGEDLRRALARGGGALERTEVLQPALVAVSLGACAALREAGLAPRYVAGHSLGELSAWSAAGGVDAAAAVDLAALRGKLMAREAARRPGGMVALVGCDERAAGAALEIGARHGEVEIAGWNAPEECVLTGDRAAIDAIAAALPAQRLPARGAWHARVMAGAVEELRRALREAAARHAAGAALVANRTGAVAAPDEIPDQLAEQLTRPFQWSRALATLAAAGVTDLVTVGPGRVLRALVRKNHLGARVLGTEDEADLARTVEALGP